MAVIITGGAGFIGSALLWALNERGETDVILVDELDHDEKEANISALSYERLTGIDEFQQQLNAGDFNDANVAAVLHMGAISSTTETDWSKLEHHNIEYTKDIIRWCADRGVRCVYASSAATYGDGTKGFSDDHDLFDQLEPLNLYGKSKLAVDIWARDAGYLEHVVGLRYFNVFGPNELHKEHMRSVIAKKFDQLQATGTVELFKSYHPDYQDGEQERDFIYVKDAVATTLHFLDHTEPTGVFNIGTGQAHTWNDVAQAMLSAYTPLALSGRGDGGEGSSKSDWKPSITYVDMPADIRDQYQYHTQADVTKLRAAGFQQPNMPLEDAIADYIQNYLVAQKHLGE